MENKWLPLQWDISSTSVGWEWLLKKNKIEKINLSCAAWQSLRAKHCAAHSISASRRIGVPFLFQPSRRLLCKNLQLKRDPIIRENPNTSQAFFIPAPQRTAAISSPLLLLNYSANIARKVLPLGISTSRQTVFDLCPLDRKRSDEFILFIPADFRW